MDRPDRNLRTRHKRRNTDVYVEATLCAAKNAAHDGEIFTLRPVEIVPGAKPARFLMRKQDVAFRTFAGTVDHHVNRVARLHVYRAVRLL